jgi:hypothetical protein
MTYTVELRNTNAIEMTSADPIYIEFLEYAMGRSHGRADHKK